MTVVISVVVISTVVISIVVISIVVISTAWNLIGKDEHTALYKMSQTVICTTASKNNI